MDRGLGDIQMRDSEATRKLYALTTSVPFEPWLVQVYGTATMNRATDRVWCRYGKGERPRVVMGRGMAVAEGGYTSYYDPATNAIVMARHQRCLHVLFHELAHALTPRAKLVHGPAFCEMFIRLMSEFGGEDEGYLRLHMVREGLVR
jgi:hypothetical protein